MSDEWPGRPWFPATAVRSAPIPAQIVSLRIPHRMDLGGEWASLLAEVDERCGSETARRIDALARRWAAPQEETGHEQGETGGE